MNHEQRKQKSTYDKIGKELKAIERIRAKRIDKLLLDEITMYQTKDIDVKPIRKFDSGATRDTDEGKLDYEGFLSPLVIERFAEYMHKHRKQSDGKLRASDNWQKGIPKEEYMKSKHRHFMDTWKLHRGLKAKVDIEESLCAELFNTMGYLYEVLKTETNKKHKLLWEIMANSETYLEPDPDKLKKLVRKLDKKKSTGSNKN